MECPPKIITMTEGNNSYMKDKLLDKIIQDIDFAMGNL